MLPHTELDNYKLQVELLQEKLKRSEENRQKLEHKLENALHKKTEHEKILRAKQRQKYEEFVNELEKRNERNRQLKQMLERIDQQTSALSARSERLRMMKMQYEMYFAKLVQSQTMRCIAQGSTSNPATIPTPIPVLLPTTPPTLQQSPSVIKATPIKNNENDPSTPSNVRVEATSSAIYQRDASGNLIAAGTVPKPVSISYTLSPACQVVQEMPSCNTITPSETTTTTAMAPLSALTAATQHWTLAMATPTPTGMLLTTTPTLGVIPTAAATTATASNVAADFVSGMPAYNYMQYPFGYLPRMQRLLQPKLNTSIYSDESDDLLQPMDANTKSSHYYHTNNKNGRDNQRYSTTDENGNRIDNDGIGSLNRIDLPTRQLDNDKDIGLLDITKILCQDNGSKQQYEQEEQQQRQQQQQQHQKPEHLLSNISKTSSTSSLTFDKLPKTMTMTEHASATASTTTPTPTPTSSSTPIDERNNNDDDGGKPKLATRFDESSKGISITGCEEKGAVMSTKGKSLVNVTTDYSTSTTTPSTVISNDNENAIGLNLRRKIDNIMMSSGQQQHMTQSWQTTENVVTSAETKPGDKDNVLNNATLTGRFVGKTENEITRNNDSSNVLPIIALQNNEGNPGLSIEKIENEIYGELVNPPINETAKNDARNAAQGLINELVTQQQHHQSENENNIENFLNDTSAIHTTYVANEPQDNIATDIEQSNSESYDPTYATIEGITNAEVYQQPTVEMPYTDDQNSSNNYAEYAAEPQQGYSNVNYENYDAAQYTEDGVAYDPTAYPGYTYDATTGQYTPDTTQQYANQDVTAGYDTQGAYEQQQYDATQENQDYDYTNYTQETENAMYTDTPAPPEQINSTQETTEPTTNVEPLAENKAATKNKPTSILSSADKLAASNDAQKKKKRVNFVDSSETDDSSSVKQGIHPNTSAAGSESDFDFSSSEKSEGNEGGA